MGWQDILKSEEGGRDELLEELVNNVHFFWEGASIDDIVRPIEMGLTDKSVYIWKPLVRSLEFMRPIKDDLEVVARGTRIYFSYYFEIFGKRCGVQFRHHELGDIFEGVLITVGGTEVCLKPTGTMTNGDFLTTLVYAVKNNAIPDIVKFVAYSSSKGHKYRVDSHVYDSSEEDYKKSFLIQLYREWEESDLFDYNEEINMELINNSFNLNDVNFWLAQFEVPEDILGRW